MIPDKENPNLFIIIVKFSNAETMHAHEQQPYIQAFAEKEMKQYCEKVFWNDAVALNCERS